MKRIVPRLYDGEMGSALRLCDVAGKCAAVHG